MATMKLNATGKFVSKCDLVLLYIILSCLFEMEILSQIPRNNGNNSVNDCKKSKKFLSAMLTTSP